jgi:hypothetical protein
VLLRIAADIEELEGTAAGRRSASGGERMLFRAWDGETRPWSVGELRPHFPDSPGGPDGSGPPGPLTAGRHVPTGNAEPSTSPHLYVTRSDPKGWLRLAAAHGFPDLGTVDIKSASPDQKTVSS